MFSSLFSMALVASAFAAPPFFAPPSFPGPPSGLARPTPGRCTCNVTSDQLILPSGQTALAAPTDPTSYVLLGVGIQNYTCSAAGTYTSVGAVADLYDLSCLARVKPMFDTVQDTVFAAWNSTPASTTSKTPSLSKIMGFGFMGNHYFITSGSSLSPVWDFRAGASKGNADAFVLAAKIAALPAPTSSQDVPWLQLKSVQGSLATQIYRTDTRGGQAPASCTPGSPPISVKYASKYWLFGGTVKA